jgi:NACHT domain/Heterokaryon incompatibility protein (HET)
MRLLKLSSRGEFTLTTDVIKDDTPYAILSHTWGADKDEVTFKDLQTGSGNSKAGYTKIRFCGEQARKDGLQYFWVDSCCIKKTSDSELSESINSMFRWYRRAAKCYVYMGDVSATKQKSGDEEAHDTWEKDFRESRWFTRGWTLQELLAPTSVEFFSKDSHRLGDKQSLDQLIHEITGIPILALRASVFSQFSAEHIFDWAENRKTTRDEDWAYSLLGLFEVSMPVIYGEGRVKAVRRLKREIEDASRDKECLQHLYATDPRHDKTRIEQDKGGLLEDSYHWILNHYDFQRWRNNLQARLLWVKGDPGKGKTMLLCGIINELMKSTQNTTNVSFFFCQATDARINNATAVLRGLLYLLVQQQQFLISHIRESYDFSGKQLFKGANAWVALSKIFTNILEDPRLRTTYLIIDALDECTADLALLLKLIVQRSSAHSRVKWIVSSRNWPSIEKDLETATLKVRLCLELNEESVSEGVTKYIKAKVDWLAKHNHYNDNTRHAVQRHLSSNANGTFLWVALVCQELANISGWKAQKRLMTFPPGLDGLYRRMIDQIWSSEDAELCNHILAIASSVYRPVTLDELVSFVDMPDGVSGDYEALSEIIQLCGSFLTLRGCSISFVHQSAKDFLLSEASHEIFPSGMADIHHVIFSRSLHIMSKTLRRDIYSLGALGYPIEQVKQPDPDPLAASRYSCIYWVNHLCDWCSNPDADLKVDLQDGGTVDRFMRKTYLYWLEALSLCRSLSQGVLSITKLEIFIQVNFKLSCYLSTVHADIT